MDPANFPKIVTCIDNFLDANIGDDWARAILFEAGTAEIYPDTVLTGANSGATATVLKVVVQAGAWSTHDAEGYILVDSGNGIAFSAETITTTTGSATAVAPPVTITEPAGYLKFAHTAAAGEHFIQSEHIYGRQAVIVADFEMPTGYQAADGAGAFIELEMFKDESNWIRFGMYRDAGQNAVAYLETYLDGVPGNSALDTTDLDTESHHYQIIVAENTILFYLDYEQCGEIALGSFTRYNVRIVAGISQAGDDLDARCTNFTAMDHIPWDALFAARTATSSAANVTQNVTLDSTTVQIVEFTTAANGDVFELLAYADLGGSNIGSCLLYDSSATSYTEYATEANDLIANAVPAVPLTGAPQAGDCLYIAPVDTGNWTMLDIMIDGQTKNTDHALAIECSNGAGGWVAPTALVDGTLVGALRLAQSGRITWNQTIPEVAVNGVTKRWIRIRVTTAGASYPRISHLHASMASDTDFDTCAAFGTVLSVSLYRKINGTTYPKSCQDVNTYQQAWLDRNIDIRVLCTTDVKLVFKLNKTPTRNVVIPLTYTVRPE